MPRRVSQELPPGYPAKRLDVALFDLRAFVSRAQAKRAIENSFVQVNGRLLKAGEKVNGGDLIEIFFPDVSPGPKAEDIPLKILFEDRDIVVVDKPAGMVVHPAAGNHTGTMVNALLHYCKNMSGIGGVLRPGVVHRLDKDTSGVIIFAKNDVAHIRIGRQFRDRFVNKVYLAVVIGRMPKPEDVIESAIGRNPYHRTKMRSGDGRYANTVWRELEVYPGASLLEVIPRTGRTHQIRVHLSGAGHPIVADKVYGTKKRVKGIQNEKARVAIQRMQRQALHAKKITIRHPRTGEIMTFESEIPEDFRELIQALRNAS